MFQIKISMRSRLQTILFILCTLYEHSAVSIVKSKDLESGTLSFNNCLVAVETGCSWEHMAAMAEEKRPFDGQK